MENNYFAYKLSRPNYEKYFEALANAQWDSKTQEKVVNERINEVEKNFGLLCSEFVAYTRRTAKLRDNGDQICKLLLLHSDQEKFNKTTQVSLKKFVEHLSAAEDYRDSEVSRLIDKVLGPLSNYGQECKHVRTNLKSAFNARKKEEDQLKKLDKIKDKGAGDPARMARSDLERASLDATKSSRDLEKEIMSFEAKKLRGLKTILRDFVQIELLWHAKALEVYSKAFNDIQMMDEEEDLEEFRLSLHPEAVVNRLQRHKHGGSQGSLQSTGSLGRGTMNSTGKSKPPSGPKPNNNGIERRHSLPQVQQTTDSQRHVRIQDYSDEEDDDLEDDDDDDDEYDDDEVSEEEESDYETTTATTPGRPAAAIINGRQQKR